MKNEIINDLVNDHKEVQKTPSFAKRFVSWLLICLLCCGAGVSLVGLREDWMILWQKPGLLLQNIFILVGIIISGAFAIKLSTPGEVKQKKNERLLYILSGSWALVLFFIGLTEGGSLAEIKNIALLCGVDILVIGLIPGIALFFFMSQGVILNRKLAAVTGVVASLGVGAFAVQYTCHNDDPIHVLVWHFLPLVILVLIGGKFGKKFFKKL